MAERPPHAIITGGSSGIGLACAQELAKNGFAVTLIARNTQRLAQAADQIRAVAPAASIIMASVDVNDYAKLQQAIADAVAQHGPVQWAIACAGICEPGKFLDQPIAEHAAQLQTNTLGTLNFAHLVAPGMIAGEGGHLILFSSVAGLVGLYGYASYGASKFAIHGLAEALMVELAPKICVSLVCPDDTDTPQLAYERARRPAVTSEIAGHTSQSAEHVARVTIAGAKAGKFLITMGGRSLLISVLRGILAPVSRRYHKSIISRLDAKS
ncbi:SDR family NAD(P)-dependent oxidoreductase [Aestuariivirga litoralis]|uniref:SDR family NAD(P)-dependent oxidoreductase n=1 Tax=Aestuariivirga litoralis TaxID=2650924 RepID=UPI0018C7BCCA|nr:SDR family NAD(P)-dependent oxidoreductase [Aestuariivirga litoralis]MBG1230780.1 SDR family NAD(P)-dependent oxidoreductase [Aestuariivirga litoralis]